MEGPSGARLLGQERGRGGGRRLGGEGDISGHADGKAAVAVVAAEPDFEGADIAFGAGDVALGGEVGVDGAVEDGAVEHVAGGEFYTQHFAETDAVDVGFFDVDTDPEVIGVDES